MRSLFIAVALLCIVAAVNCSSIASRKKRQDEPVIIVDAGSRRSPFTPLLLHGVPMASEDDILDEPGSFGFTRFGSGFSKRLNTMLAGLQAQFDNLWKRFYDRTDTMRPDVPSTNGMFPPLYHNTTSTRKVVNGSIITVNETIDKHSDNDSMSFFHVKVIHVRPENPFGLPENDEPESDEGEVPESKTPQPPIILEASDVTEAPDREQLKPDLPSDKTNELEDNMP